MRSDKALASEQEFSGSECSIRGMFKFQRLEHIDPRGSFSKLFNKDDMTRFGWPEITHQVNFSRTELAGSIRGMHIQLGSIPEFKLVTCVRGSAWDVCVDLRKNSPTFLKWEAIELYENEAISVLIPPGCAHGFQSLSDETHLAYCHSAPFDPGAEVGINPFDTAIGIFWPRELTNISERDRGHASLPSDFKGFAI